MINFQVIVAKNETEARKKFEKLYRYEIVDIVEEARRFSAVLNYDRPGAIHYIIKYDMSKYRK